MAEEKKRFPWWLVAGGLAAVILAAARAVSFIETTGRRGALVVGYERITARMPEADVLAILGPPQTTKEADFPDRTLLDPPEDDGVTAAPETLAVYFSQLAEHPLRSGDGLVITRTYTWRDGPAKVSIVVMRQFQARYIVERTGLVDRGAAFPNWSGGWVVAKRHLRLDDGR
jgi:hypothetical protein